MGLGEGLAYKDMKEAYYLSFTLLLMITIVFGALFIPKVSILVDYVATISVNSLSFLFPSLFFIVANERYGCDDYDKNYWIKTAYLQGILGILSVIFGFYNNLLNLF